MVGELNYLTILEVVVVVVMEEDVEGDEVVLVVLI